LEWTSPEINLTIGLVGLGMLWSRPQLDYWASMLGMHLSWPSTWPLDWLGFECTTPELNLPRRL